MSVRIPIWTYHEAAHAVVAEVCGQRVSCISWGNGDPQTDWTSVSLPLDDLIICCRNLCTWMTIDYAGICVDDSYVACKGDMDSIDRCRAVLQEQEGPIMACYHQQEACASAKQILRKHKSAVKAIAAALHARAYRGEKVCRPGSLSGDEIRQIMADIRD